MNQVHHVTVAEEEAGLRLDRWFRRRFPDLAHGRLQKLLRTGQVRLDGQRAAAGARVAPGQVVRVPPLSLEAAARKAAPAPPAPDQAALEALRDAVLYRDDWVLAIDKPAGLAVQGGSGQRQHLDAMLDALRLGAAERPRLVHRLDKDTSGVLLLARSLAAARALAETFKGKAARKTYWAAVAGVPRPARGRIVLPLSKAAGRGGERMGGDRAAGKEAITLYETVARSDRRASWLLLAPLTGRTHQLRVHCAALGHPILGDGKYGGRAAFLDGDLPIRRLHLHAREIAVPHPADGTTLRITAPLPAHMQATWDALGFDSARGAHAAIDFEA